VSLKGAPELHRRIKAIVTVPNWVGRQWAEQTTRVAKPMIPVKTGATRASVRPQFKGKQARVVGKYTVNFIDAGAKAHDEPRSRFTKTGRLRRGKAAGSGKTLKFNSGGMTLFRRKIHKPQQTAHPFKKRAAAEGLRKVSPLREIIARWNRAA
jgi:hypothetical protein